MYKTKIILLVFNIFFSYNYIFAQGNEVFRIMTYNIRYAGGEAEDDLNFWGNRKELIETMLRINRPDIIGFQEVLKNQLDDLVEMLPEFKWIGVGRDDGKDAGEFLPIFYRKDKFSLIEHSTFWLSETPEKISKGWDGCCNRITTWAKLKHLQTNTDFIMMNTHFDHIGKIAQRNSAKLIIQKLNEILDIYPVVVSGDFNVRSSSETYNIITGKPENSPKKFLKDVHFVSTLKHYGGNITFNGFGNLEDKVGKIDYIFVNDKVTVFTHGIISEKIENRFPSDHWPVISDISIR